MLLQLNWPIRRSFLVPAHTWPNLGGLGVFFIIIFLYSHLTIKALGKSRKDHWSCKSAPRDRHTGVHKQLCTSQHTHTHTKTLRCITDSESVCSVLVHSFPQMTASSAVLIKSAVFNYRPALCFVSFAPARRQNYFLSPGSINPPCLWFTWPSLSFLSIYLFIYPFFVADGEATSFVFLSMFVLCANCLDYFSIHHHFITIVKPDLTCERLLVEKCFICKLMITTKCQKRCFTYVSKVSKLIRFLFKNVDAALWQYNSEKPFWSNSILGKKKLKKWTDRFFYNSIGKKTDADGFGLFFILFTLRILVFLYQVTPTFSVQFGPFSS